MSVPALYGPLSVDCPEDGCAAWVGVACRRWDRLALDWEACAAHQSRIVLAARMERGTAVVAPVAPNGSPPLVDEAGEYIKPHRLRWRHHLYDKGTPSEQEWFSPPSGVGRDMTITPYDGGWRGWRVFYGAGFGDPIANLNDAIKAAEDALYAGAYELATKLGIPVLPRPDPVVADTGWVDDPGGGSTRTLGVFQMRICFERRPDDPRFGYVTHRDGSSTHGTHELACATGEDLTKAKTALEAAARGVGIAVPPDRGQP